MTNDKQIELPQPNLYEMIGRKDAVIAALSLEVERLREENLNLHAKVWGTKEKESV